MDNGELFASVMAVLGSGGTVNLPVNGWSMRPFLMPGRDSVVLSPPGERVRRGDVVLHRRDDGKYILHRICRVKPNAFYSVGDAEAKPIEGPLRFDQIKALAVAANRKGRHIDFAKSVGWRLFTFLWLLLRPFRPCIMGFVTVLYKIIPTAKKAGGHENKIEDI